jgi:hypothetical protein
MHQREKLGIKQHVTGSAYPIPPEEPREATEGHELQQIQQVMKTLNTYIFMQPNQVLCHNLTLRQLHLKTKH